MDEEAKRLLNAAERYLRQHYSVIPIKKDPNPDFDKKALIKWKKFQSEISTINDVKKGLKRTSNSMIAIVTGKRANLTVVDLDTIEAIESIDDLLPESLEIPTVESPGGGRHYYFQHVPGLPNRSNILPGVDIRNEGGYIGAPPSTGTNGKPYKYLNGCSLDKIKPPPMPEILRDTLLQAAAGQASSCEHIKMQASSSGDYKGAEVTKITTDYKRLQVTTGDFKQGERDQALFHLANTLIKGGMGEENILKYLLFFASHCDPPFPEKEILAKIASAKKRNSKADLNISEEVRDYVLTTDGYFLTTDCFNRLQVTTRSEKKAVVAELLRLKTKGIIERHGNKNGCYRRIESDCEPEDWQNACTDTVDLWLPFDLNEMISIMPGNIILFAGAQDAGKSAALMNITKENMRKWNVHYFSSELNAGAFKSRLNNFPDLSIDQWKVNFYPRSENFHDVIKTGPNDLNLIDYMEVHKEFYIVAEYLANIHKKLGHAICIVALQKDPNALYGRGGSFTQEKPILSVSLDHGRATISKFKGEFKGGNPRGMEYHFKLANGCRLIKVRGWQKPIPKQKK